jgi:hypothetical protein
MRVYVDPARSDKQTVGIYVAMCVSRRYRAWFANLGNDPINKCNISVPRWRTGAVDQIGPRENGSFTGLHNWKI